MSRPLSKHGTSPTRAASRTPEERDAYIAEHFGTMSYREMGEVLGCSRTSVYRRVKALGLTEEQGAAAVRAAVERIEANPSAPENDQLRRLYELRDQQHAMLRVAGPNSFSAISREYRETLRQIAELQAGESATEGEPDVAGPMADLMAAMPDLSSLAAMTADG